MGLETSTLKENPHIFWDGIFNLEKASKDDGTTRVIRGYMSIPKVDAENEIIDRAAYPDAINEVKKRMKSGRPVPLFIEHRRKELSLPVGSLIDAGEDSKGLWFKGMVAKGPIGDSVWDLIEQGMLYGCSMGGDAVKTHIKYDQSVQKDVRVIDKMIFRELSLTGLPVNDESVFKIAKSMYCTHEGKCGSHKGLCDCKSAATRFSKSLDNLDGQIEKAIINNFEKAADDLKKEPNNDEYLERVKTSLKELAQVLGIEQEAAEQLQDKLIGETEQKAAEEQKKELPPKVQQKEEQQKREERINEEPKKEEPKEVIKPEVKQIPVEPQPNAKKEIEEQPTEKTLCPECEAKAKEGKTLCPECEAKHKKEKTLCPDCKNKKDSDLNVATKPKIETWDETKQKDEQKDLTEEHPTIKSDEEDKALVSSKPVTLESLGKKIEELAQLIKQKGGENVEDLIKCLECDTVFEKSADYEADFCPKCGADLSLDSDIDTEEEIVADIDSDEEGEEEYADASAEAFGGEETEEEEALEGEHHAEPDGDEGVEDEPLEEILDEGDDAEDEEVLECEECKAMFGKSIGGYEMKHCPKCGGHVEKSDKMSIAVADSPKGAATKYEKKPSAKKGGDMSIAIAANPKGASTKYKSKGGKFGKNLDVRTNEGVESTGESVNAARKGEGSYIDANKKEVDNENNSTIHDWDDKFTTRAGGVDSAKFSNYEKDRIGKSMADMEDRIVSRIEKSLRKSSGRKSLVPQEEGKKIEKSVSVEERTKVASERFLAQVFTGKLKI